MARPQGRGGATWCCSGFLCRPQGNFTVSGDLDVLQVKEEGILEFLAGGTHFGDTYLDFRMEQDVCEWRRDGTYIVNLKRIWEQLLLRLMALKPLETWLMSGPCPL